MHLKKKLEKDNGILKKEDLFRANCNMFLLAHNSVNLKCKTQAFFAAFLLLVRRLLFFHAQSYE